MNTIANVRKQYRDELHRQGAAKVAQHLPQTFKLCLASGFDAWLIGTLTGWAGQGLTVSSHLPCEPTELRLTYRPGTIGVRELRLLVEEVLQFREAGQTLRVQTDEFSDTPSDDMRNDALISLARHAHLYLDDFDIDALVRDVHGFDMRTKIDVVGRRVPSTDTNRAELVMHMRLCAACFRLTYLHEDGYRVASLSHQVPDESKPALQA